MRHPSAILALAAALLASPPTPIRAAPAVAPQEAPPASAGSPDRQRNGAAKLAGMIRFVAGFCPKAQPDYGAFKRVIAAMGVDIKDLEHGQLMMDSLSYFEAYKKDQAASCQRAQEHFGENGRTIPGLVAVKAPAKAEPETVSPVAKPAGEASPAPKP